jgi:hypothetical protein
MRRYAAILLSAMSVSFTSFAQAQTTAPAPVAEPAAPPAPQAPSPTAAAPQPAANQPLWQPPPPAQPAPVPDTNTSTMNNNLTLFGAVGYGYGYGTGFGLGIRYQIRVASHILHLPPGKHDEFGIEFGMDYFHVSYRYAVLNSSADWSYNEFTPLAGFTWNFWLTDKLVVYPKADLGYRFVSWNNDVGGYDAGVLHIYFQGAAGIGYAVGPVRLRAEVGWNTLRLGVALPLF